MRSENIIITAVLMIAAVPSFYGFTFYQKSQSPVSFRLVAEKIQPGHSASFDKGDCGIFQGEDPCKGTGGTGQIVSVGNNTITIKLRDGINEIINLTDKTTIKNSAGSISKSDLKTGDRVTVVVMSNHTATVVLVCNASSSKPVK